MMRKCLFQKKTENNLTVKLEGQHKEIYEGILTETREMYKKMMMTCVRLLMFLQCLQD